MILVTDRNPVAKNSGIYKKTPNNDFPLPPNTNRVEKLSFERRTGRMWSISFLDSTYQGNILKCLYVCNGHTRFFNASIAYSLIGLFPCWVLGLDHESVIWEGMWEGSPGQKKKNRRIKEIKERSLSWEEREGCGVGKETGWQFFVVFLSWPLTLQINTQGQGRGL